MRLRCAGSDLQSRSMCSPTTTSGISPRLTGTGVLQRGHTGTCTSCRDKKRGLGARSWATSSAVQPSLPLSGSACHSFHSVTCDLRSCSAPSKEAVSDPAQAHTLGRGDRRDSRCPNHFTQWQRAGCKFAAQKYKSRLSGNPQTWCVCPSDQRRHAQVQAQQIILIAGWECPAALCVRLD